MSKSEDKLVQYLNEAHATELALVSTLRAHISMTPTGSYRRLLEEHLEVTRGQSDRIRRRLSELGVSKNLVQTGVGAIQSVVGQILSLTKGPIDMLRGERGEEKLLKNAKDECATEALEIATYDALEQLALELSDEVTARLAADHRTAEEAMLAGLREEIPSLTRDVVAAEIYGHKRYEPSEVGGRHAAQDAAQTASRAAASVASEARAQARGAAAAATGAAKGAAGQVRRVPGEEQVEGEARGSVASEDDLPIAGYDSLNANEVIERLPRLSQVELGQVDAYERRHAARKTVLGRLDALRGDEPWAGYDHESAPEVQDRLRDLDEGEARQVRDYERRHKGRQSVLDAAEAKVGAASGS
jgi:ferritin-like metal-binding protein YciE